MARVEKHTWTKKGGEWCFIKSKRGLGWGWDTEQNTRKKNVWDVI